MHKISNCFKVDSHHNITILPKLPPSPSGSKRLSILPCITYHCKFRRDACSGRDISLGLFLITNSFYTQPCSSLAAFQSSKIFEEQQMDLEASDDSCITYILQLPARQPRAAYKCQNF